MLHSRTVLSTPVKQHNCSAIFAYRYAVEHQQTIAGPTSWQCAMVKQQAATPLTHVLVKVFVTIGSIYEK